MEFGVTLVIILAIVLTIALWKTHAGRNKEREAYNNLYQRTHEAEAECDRLRNSLKTAEAELDTHRSRANLAVARAEDAQRRATASASQVTEMMKQRSEQAATITRLQTDKQESLNRAQREKQDAVYKAREEKQRADAEKFRADKAEKQLAQAETELGALKAVVPPNLVRAAVKQAKAKAAASKKPVSDDDTVTNVATCEVFKPARAKNGKILGWMNVRTGEITDKSPFEGSVQKKLKLSA